MKLILSIFILISFSTFGQLSKEEKEKVSKLKKTIATAKNDTVVINAMKALDDIIYRVDPNMDLQLNRSIDSISTLHLKEKLSEKERDFYLRSKGFSTGNLGFVYNSKGKNTKALMYFYESLEAKKTRGDLIGVARTYSNIGAVYHEQGIYLKAIEYYTKALHGHKKADDKKGTAGALNNIAVIHRLLENHDSALKFYNESLKIKKEINDTVAIAVAYLNIGKLYGEMDRHSDARKTLLRSLDISKKAGNKEYEAIAYVHLGLVDQSEKKWDAALKYFFMGFEIQQEINDNKMLAESAVYIAEVFFEKGDIGKAKQYGEMSLKMSQEYDLIEVSEKASKVLFETYKALGQNAPALRMLELNVKLSDSITRIEIQKAAIREEFKYDYAKKVAADSTLAVEEAKVKDARLAAEVAKKKQREQQMYYLYAGLALSLIFTGIIFNRFRHARKQKNIIELQKEKVDKAYNELDIEKKKSDELLLNILPEEVAEELKTDGIATPKHYDQATILFTDFKGFTTIASQVSPKELVETLNECFSSFDDIVERHNLEKIKTIGDAYMCAGGVPVGNGTNAIDAVKAGLEMVNWVNAWNADRRARNLPTLEIRIGIHTGELVAGVIGFKKFAYDVWGDAVNVASRMETSGEPGRINISDATYGIVKDQIETEYRGEIEVKNRGKIGMYFVKSS